MPTLVERRDVSPPVSPVQPIHSGSTGSQGTREPIVVSRVLAHSRSLMDLNKLVDLSYPPAST